MSDGRKRILSPFTGRKKRKAWNNTKEKYKPVKRRQNLPEADRESYYDKEEWLEEFLDGKGAFYNGSESDDSENDDGNYNENDQQQLAEGFANSCYKIVSPIPLLELTTNFAVCKHCSGTLLLVENVNHGFGQDISKRNQFLLDQPRTCLIFMLRKVTQIE